MSKAKKKKSGRSRAPEPLLVPTADDGIKTSGRSRAPEPLLVPTADDGKKASGRSRAPQPLLVPVADDGNEEKLLKIILIGDSGVGKTCLLNKYNDNAFDDNWVTTIGVDFKVKRVSLSNKNFKLQIWDTAGAENFRATTSAVYKGAHAIIMTYSVTDRSSFDNVKSTWKEEKEKYAASNCATVLVGLKSDLSDRSVSTQEGKDLAKELSCPFVEVSSKRGVNVEGAFHLAARQAMKEIDPTFNFEIKFDDGLSSSAAGVDPIQAALQQGSKEWGRSRIMIVGEGRAGKTALANSIVGKSFQQTESTIGINQLTCDVSYASRGGQGSWDAYQKPEKELEAAIAALVASQRRMEEQQKKAEKESEVLLASATDANTTEQLPAHFERETVEEEQDTDLLVEPPSAVAVRAVEQGKPAKDDGNAGAGVVETGLDDGLNAELVMKLLSDFTSEESSLIISVFDYGGQSIFNVIHHLFLTHNGVYLLVFNMEWLLSTEDIKLQCLAYLKFWINSIIVHTFDSNLGTTAPIALVGTRKDIIKDPGDHEKISTMLFEEFARCKAWPSVLENTEGQGTRGTTTFWFFPVDNTQGRDDPTVKRLLTVAEKAMDDDFCTHKLVPLKWLKTLDAIQAQKKSCLSLDTVAQLAAESGITGYDVRYFLLFLHEMGMVLWHDEPGLGEVVILDAVSYLVTPATHIICKHIPDLNDPTHHVLDVHKECNRRHYNEWLMLSQNGLLSDKLLPILWRDFSEESPTLLKLMIKFGLLIPLNVDNDEGIDQVANSDQSPSANKQYLVPALLPLANLSDADFMQWTQSSYTSCYIVFTSFSDFESYTTITAGDLKTYGFLPSGLFERIIGKSVVWCQATSHNSQFNIRNVGLYRNVAIMSFGRQRFRLTAYDDMNCIRLDAEGKNPLAVHDRMIELIRAVMKECMKSLRCFSALYYDCDTVSNHEGDVSTLSSETASAGILIPLNQLREVASSRSVLNKPGGRKLLSDEDVRRLYEPWLQLYDLRSEYDFFVSYRWGLHDDTFVSVLFDMFTNHSVGNDNRAIEVFLDKKRLKTGRRFDMDFAKALINSTVMLPVVSSDGLQRMFSHDPAKVDNLLLEWIIGIECYHSDKSKLQAILPLMFGNRVKTENSDGYEVITIERISGPDILSCLPDLCPAATLDLASKMLCDGNIPISTENFMQRSLCDVISAMLKFLYFSSWEIPPQRVVTECAGRAVEVLRSIPTDVRETDPSLLNGNVPSADAGSSKNSFSEAWEILSDDKFVSDRAAMTALLEDWGVYSGADLADIESEHIDQLAPLLKAIPRKKFIRLVTNVAA